MREAQHRQSPKPKPTPRRSLASILGDHYGECVDGQDTAYPKLKPSAARRWGFAHAGIVAWASSKSGAGSGSSPVRP